MTKILYPFQDDALNAVLSAHAEGHGRALVVMATGLGKTVVAAAMSRYWLTEDSEASLLFMTHRTDILRQARLEFMEACGDDVTTGIVSSDETENPDARVLFMSFQSMEARREHYGKTRFSLVIVDEAHHGQAVTFREVIEFFTPVLLFGMTATPNRGDNLDIREIFGNEVYDYPLAKALAEGHLCGVDYRLLTDNIDLARLRAYIKAVAGGDRKVTKKHLDTNIFLEERMDRQVDMIREAQKGGKRTAIFCRNMEDLMVFNLRMPEAVPYHSYLDKVSRGERMAGFRVGDVQTFLVVDMLNEGVDIPDLELVVFRRATDSMTVWLQQLGRALRKLLGKSHATVLDFAANCDRVLAVHELGKEVKKWGGGSGMQDPLVIEGPGWNIQFTEEIRDLIAMLERLDVEFYPTYEEAKAAVQRLEITTVMEYGRRFREDPRLPSNPNVNYRDVGWKGWPHFCGTDTYATIEEAMAAVQRLKPIPTTATGYSDVRRQDLHLPGSPDHEYGKKGWQSWPHFLSTQHLGNRNRKRKGGRNVTGFYSTCEEARSAVQRLNPIPTTGPEYDLVYHQDPRLHSSPDYFYRGKGWIGWPHFLKMEDAPGRKRPVAK